MKTPLQNSSLRLTLFPLMLMCLSTPPVPDHVTARQDLPAGLAHAMLAASARPIEVEGDGFRARSGGLDFTLRDGTLAADDFSWRLTFIGLGRGDQIVACAEPTIGRSDDQVEFYRDGLTEWYRDTSLGLEQGFTVHRAPPGAGPLMLHLDLSSVVSPAADAGGRGLSFTGPDGRTLRYDHLRAWDADGADLDASLVYGSGRITLQVNDRGAAYPILIDPVVYLERKVIASGATNYLFGIDLAVSGDTALIGASAEDIGTNADQGAAYVFVRIGPLWSLQQKLIAADGAAGDQLGHAVALSGDTALVGANLDDSEKGSAYVFTRSGTVWSLQQKLTASDGAAGDVFGDSVALSGDTALVGAAWDDVGGNVDQGSAYVFARSGTTWTQQAKLTASDGAADDVFGSSAAISGDTALVGAHSDDFGPGHGQGSAYVFARSGTTWTQQAKLTAADPADFDRFGDAVSLSSDGNTALVGAIYDDVGGNNTQGSAYVFMRSGTIWTQQAQLTAADGVADDHFGGSVVLSDDGNTALVGAASDDVGANASQGSAYIFTRSGTTWTQQAQLTAADGAADDFFGMSVAISGDTVLIGAYRDDVGANADQGTAHIFARFGTLWSQQQKLTSSDGALGDNFGISVAIAGDTALVGAWYDDIGANADQGSAYVFLRNGTNWELQQKLTASDGAALDYFGYSVALSSDGNTALVGAYSDDIAPNANQGSAYVFVRSGTTWTEQVRLFAADGAANDNFGVSVALAADGNTALVGAFLDDFGANADQGSAYVFVRIGTAWGQQTKMTGSDSTAGDNFGRSVALSGNTALVGAPRDQVGANTLQGSAYVFVRGGTIWTQQGHLTALDGATQDWFGFSVAVAGDTALVGAYNNDVFANVDQGSAYAFVRSGTSWSEQMILTASGTAAGDHCGRAVALSNDGNTALVGAYMHDYGADADQGGAYVFMRSGTTWSQPKTFFATDGAASDLFGVSVAISGDTFLVGAHQADIGGINNQGAVYFNSPATGTYLPLILKN